MALYSKFACLSARSATAYEDILIQNIANAIKREQRKLFTLNKFVVMLEDTINTTSVRALQQIYALQLQQVQRDAFDATKMIAALTADLTRFEQEKAQWRIVCDTVKFVLDE